MKPELFIILVSDSDVIRLHDTAIEKLGGRKGIHSAALLDSAVNHVMMVIEYGNNKDREISHLAAIYFYHIINNHPFNDGNKRAALLSALEFIIRNEFDIIQSDTLYDDLYELALQTASSKKTVKEIAIFFKKIIKN